MKLHETMTAMMSDRYEDRLRAEYWQLKIRMDRLHRKQAQMVARDIITDNLAANPRLAMLDDQYEAMERYLKTLEVRAALDSIDLGDE